MLTRFMLPGFDRTDGDDYPVWTTGRDATDGVYCGRGERGPQPARNHSRPIVFPKIEARKENMCEYKVVVEKGGDAVRGCKWVLEMQKAGE